MGCQLRSAPNHQAFSKEGCFFCCWGKQEVTTFQAERQSTWARVWHRNRAGQQTQPLQYVRRSGRRNLIRPGLWRTADLQVGGIRGTIHTCQNILFPKSCNVCSWQRLALSVILGHSGWSGEDEKQCPKNQGNYVAHRWENHILITEISIFTGPLCLF